MFTGLYYLLLQPKTGTLADTLKEEHIIIILVIFCLILFGMCFTFIFNCVRKLIHDHRIIQVSVTRCLLAVTRSYKVCTSPEEICNHKFVKFSTWIHQWKSTILERSSCLFDVVYKMRMTDMTSVPSVHPSVLSFLRLAEPLKEIPPEISFGQMFICRCELNQCPRIDV